ncbi:uncharacterized protein [Onthophagus taurus]|uniref:uncharacterized protein n=1 Tax=Onthophagus taurus TaxID=166361 RepID=UPI000C20FA03|nr:uncharacterized protein LOC111416402 [Onthophagus taurus]
MSKSNSSTRSNSVESPDHCESAGDLGSPQKQNVPAILEGAEGQEVPSSPPPSYEFVLEETRKAQAEATTSPTKGPQILHKSSKELYKAVAKQFGITCKMSDQCRCVDCQIHYFDCDSDQNEHQKSDGGLSAGTPLFVSELIHGSTPCSIL